MAFYAYPRLPQKMPLWLNFFGQQTIMMDKSPLFFIYPLAQTLFCLFFMVAARILSSKEVIPWKARLLKEYVYLSLIFFNLIFIHIHRSLIFLAHQVGKSVDKFYFYSLFGIILVLIPYYHMLEKMYIKKHREGL